MGPIMSRALEKNVRPLDVWTLTFREVTLICTIIESEE
ncbi:unnamed protein product [Brassica rapa subsp. trilocularis]